MSGRGPCLSLHAQTLAECQPIVRAEIINVIDLIIIIIIASMDFGLWPSRCRPFTCLSRKRLLWQVAGDGPFKRVKSLIHSQVAARGPRPSGPSASTQHCRELSTRLGAVREGPFRPCPIAGGKHASWVRRSSPARLAQCGTGELTPQPASGFAVDRRA